MSQMVILVRPSTVDSGRIADIIVSIIGMQLPTDSSKGKCISVHLSARSKILLTAGLELTVGVAIPIVIGNVFHCLVRRDDNWQQHYSGGCLCGSLGYAISSMPGRDSLTTFTHISPSIALVATALPHISPLTFRTLVLAFVSTVSASTSTGGQQLPAVQVLRPAAAEAEAAAVCPGRCAGPLQHGGPRDRG